MPKRRRPNFKFPKPPRPWDLSKQKKKAGLIAKMILAAEDALPGGTGAEKKRWVKDKIDSLIQLPPPFEAISDFFIEVGTEIAYAGVQQIRANQSLVVLDRAKYEEHLEDYKKLKANYRDLYKRWSEQAQATP